nr:reverse transcriptase domain-containing protein [Tanacetum cinerariifolium]
AIDLVRVIEDCQLGSLGLARIIWERDRAHGGVKGVDCIQWRYMYYSGDDRATVHLFWQEILFEKIAKFLSSWDDLFLEEILEEDFDALLDEGSRILHSIKGTLLKEEIFSEFNDFIAMTANENSESKSDTEEPPFKKIAINADYKIKTSLEEPSMDLEIKPLPDNLEYVFLEEPSFLPMIMSSKLSAQNKSKIVSVLKKHKQAFAWKTTYIPGKCHFMVKEGIVLGHTVSSAGLEVDKAKINAISKLPSPTNIKEIKDRKGTENVVVDHLSRIENDESSDDSEVDDNFPEETLMEWVADFANYLVANIIPKGMTYQQKNKFFFDLEHYFWEEPYLFK